MYKCNSVDESTAFSLSFNKESSSCASMILIKKWRLKSLKFFSMEWEAGADGSQFCRSGGRPQREGSGQRSGPQRGDGAAASDTSSTYQNHEVSKWSHGEDPTTDSTDQGSGGGGVGGRADCDYLPTSYKQCRAAWDAQFSNKAFVLFVVLSCFFVLFMNK